MSRDDCANDANGVQTTSQPVLGKGGVAGSAQKGGRVCGDSGDTSPRSHNLEEQAEPGAAAQVSAGLAAPTDEDLSKLNGGARLALFGHGDNLEEFVLNFRGIATADMGKDFTGIVIATNGCKVTRGVGQRLYTKQQEDGRNALESEKKSPADVGVAIIDKRKAEREPVGDGDAQVVGDEDVSKKTTTMGSRGSLRNKHRSDTGKSASSKTGDNTSNEDEVRGLRSSLKSTADQSEDRTDPKTENISCKLMQLRNCSKATDPLMRPTRSANQPPVKQPKIQPR